MPSPVPDDLLTHDARVMALEAALRERGEQIQLLQDELDETNRGVVALYAELDDQAEQLRRAKRVSDTKFLAVYEQAPTGIALLDADGRILETNPAMARLLGRPQAGLPGLFLRDLAEPEWTPMLDALSVPQASAVARQEVPMRRADGSLTHLEWSSTPGIDADLTLALATDVSQRVELERLRVQWLERERVARGEAEHASRAKDDFVAVLAHELRTPLNAIAGWAQVLRRQAPESLQRGVDAIERNCATQARMISDLLDMSRLRLGKLAMTFAPIDPVHEITEAANALRGSLEQHGLTLDVSVQGAPRRIQADASRLQQVVWNLLTNAIKFTPRGGSVRITLAERPASLRFSVADTGQGIAPDFLPLVFDRFAQSDAGSNRQRGGLGLGLAIVRQIVEAHGGTIAVASPGAGRGTTFTLELPFIQDDAGHDETAKDELDAAAMPLAGLDLILVDDDDDALAVLAVVLVDRGATVRVASDADACLVLLAARRPSALISDIGLPGRDGYTLIRQIRARDADAGAVRLPAIALTAFTRDEDRRQALEAGFDAHCGKPLKPLEVVRQVVMLVAPERRDA